MKKWMLLLVLLFIPVWAQATDLEDALFVSDAKHLDGGEISIYASDGGNYLFLPAFVNAADLRVSLHGVDAIDVNGAQLRNGNVTDEFQPGQTIVITCDGVSYPVEVMQSQNIPAVFLRTASGSTSYIHQGKEYEETGTMLLVDQHGATEYDGELTQIRIRGNSTVRYEKKAYQIKLEDGTALLGMDKSKTWVLLANYIDRSLLRNTLALELASAAGLAYTSESTPVDVYVNGDYMGNYLLCEKVAVDEDRVDIVELEEVTQAVNEESLEDYPFISNTETDQGYDDWRGGGYRYWRRQLTPGSWKALDIPKNPADITGGYLLEVTLARSWDEETSGFVCASGWPIVLKEPENATVAQVQYTQSIFQEIDSALDAEDGWGELSALIDVDSWVSKYVLEEIVGNYDGGTGSQFFYKDADWRDPLIYSGPAWDYDNTLGVNALVGAPDRFYVQSRSEERHALFPRLYEKEAFRVEVYAVYGRVYRELLDVLLGNTESAEGQRLLSIEAYAEVIRASAEMNFVRWPIDYSYHERVQNTGNTFQENVDFLIDFLEKRVGFLDENWL